MREQIRDEVLVNRLRAREIESRVVVSDQDVDRFPATRGRMEQSEHRVSHILVSVPEGANAQTRKRLREKIEVDPTRPVRLQTVWGVGYRWEISS